MNSQTRIEILEKAVQRLEDQQRVLKERLDILSKQLYREVFGTERGNQELEDRQAEIEEWSRTSEEFS